MVLEIFLLEEDREDSEDEVDKAPSNTSDPTIDRDIQTPINKPAYLESGKVIFFEKFLFLDLSEIHISCDLFLDF